VSPDTLIPISVTDLSEAEAKKALLIADPLSALAEQDSAALESLMRDVQIADEALAAMVAGMAEDAGIIPPEQPDAPTDFNEVDETIETAYCCPKCGYRWSGGTGVATESESTG
jgi:hypothetical protein